MRDLPSDVKNTRFFAVETASSDEDLLDLFAFHVSRDYIQINVIEARSVGALDSVAETAVASADDPQRGTPMAASPGFGFFDGAPGARPLDERYADGTEHGRAPRSGRPTFRRRARARV